MKVGLFAVSQNDEGQNVAQNTQNSDPDEEDPFDPELGRLEDRVVDGEVFVAEVNVYNLVLPH